MEIGRNDEVLMMRTLIKGRKDEVLAVLHLVVPRGGHCNRLCSELGWLCTINLGRIEYMKGYSTRTGQISR